MVKALRAHMAEVADSAVRGAEAQHPLDRLEGAVLGFAIGDALGIAAKSSTKPVVGLSSLRDGEVNYGTHTKHFIASTESILRHGGLEFDDIVPQLKDYGEAQELSPSFGILSGIPFNLFSTLLPAPRKLMHGEIGEIISLTNSSEESLQTGELVEYFVHEMMYGKDADATILQIYMENAFLTPQLRNKLWSLREKAEFIGYTPRMAIQEIGASGNPMAIMESAAFSEMVDTNFEDAVLFAINGTGDTVSRGALTGTLAGLYYGLHGIPDDLRDGVAQSEGILDRAYELFKLIRRLR